jgi:1-acyl-sn-glycerol-3-phosphate acyltransferase
MYIPVFGWGLWAANHIAINRAQAVKAFKDVVKQGKERLAHNMSILIFPEGTRTAIGEHPAFQKSGAALAKMAKAQVVPVAINSGHCWPRNSMIKRPGTVTLAFGPAINTADKSVDEVNELAYEWVKATMQRLDKV